MASSSCSSCGAIVGVPAGKPSPPHQPNGSRGKCPGSGRPTTTI